VLFDDFPPVLQLQLKRFEYNFQTDSMVKVGAGFPIRNVLMLQKCSCCKNRYAALQLPDRRNGQTQWSSWGLCVCGVVVVMGGWGWGADGGGGQ
jgi:hypothetical protein